jgi:hypothetical protein
MEESREEKKEKLSILGILRSPESDDIASRANLVRPEVCSPPPCCTALHPPEKLLHVWEVSPVILPTWRKVCLL